jgi:HlyD family secretion protein
VKYLRAVVLLAVVALLSGAAACYFGWLPNPLSTRADTATTGSSPDGSGAADSDGPRFMGWVEPAGGVINLDGIPGDRLKRLAVAEGEAVEKDQVLATMESRALKQQQVDLLVIQIAEAAAHRDAESQQDLERQQLVAHRAKTEWDAAKAELRSLQETRNFSEEAAKADYAAAVAAKDAALTAIPLKSLQQRLEMAKSDLALAEIKAPCKGTVLKIFVREGESIAQKPILCMADLERMVALAEVYEVNAKGVACGQTAIVRSPAFHAPRDESGLQGKVVAIGRMVNTPELKSLNPFQRVDRHVIPIRIELDEKDGVEAARFVNLQVDVELQAAGK